MPFDGSHARPQQEDDPLRCCRSCKQPIFAGEQAEYLHFERDGLHAVHQVNGAYHAACARPFLSLVRALEAARVSGR